jgi:hypothetical protein
MIKSESIISHSPSVVSRRTGDEYVLVPVANNIADMNSVYTLNETGAFIWDLIDGKRSVDEIVNMVVEKYDTDKGTAMADVSDFVESMREFLNIK